MNSASEIAFSTQLMCRGVGEFGQANREILYGKTYNEMNKGKV